MGCPAPKLSQIRKSDWEEGNELTSTVQLAKLIFSRGEKKMMIRREWEEVSVQRVCL